MQLSVLFCLSVCNARNFVNGEMALGSDEGENPQSSVLLMMYRFLDDILAINNQMNAQQEEILQLKYENDQLESQVKECGPKKGNVYSTSFCIKPHDFFLN